MWMTAIFLKPQGQGLGEKTCNFRNEQFQMRILSHFSMSVLQLCRMTQGDIWRVRVWQALANVFNSGFFVKSFTLMPSKLSTVLGSQNLFSPNWPSSDIFWSVGHKNLKVADVKIRLYSFPNVFHYF